MRANIFFILLLIAILSCNNEEQITTKPVLSNIQSADCWTGAPANQIPVDKSGELIRYGRNLIENTAYYLGPNGKLQHITNVMNCQNCCKNQT